ncbi:MAG: type II secretion system protein [Thiobacillus sp.]|nr:type II secretion system protein [Thiobacillus sp.]
MTSQRGFSLIELAIVLVIVTILIGGLAVPLSAQIQARRIAETNKTLEEAREAIAGYAITHTCSCVYNDVAPAGIPLPFPQTTCTACPPNNPSSSNTTLKRPYLPCPAGVDGREDRTGASCNRQDGLIPWVDLATAAQDAWGNRLRYAVDTDLANSTDFSKGIHNTSSGAWNQISSSITKCAPLDVDVAANVPIVLLSHGPNGRGARNVNIPQSSATPAPPAATSPDELQNLGSVQTGCTTKNFISSSPSEVFDDLLTWVSFPQLINRVCPAGGCP